MDEENVKEIVEDEAVQLDYYQGYLDGVNQVQTQVIESKQRWYKSKVLWISILSLLGVVIVNVFNVIDSEVWNTIVTAVLSIMSVFGIVNSPSSSNSLE